MTTTRQQIRRDVLRKLGDLRILTATDAGADVTFVDTRNLTGGLNAYAGREALFTGGTADNLGEVRYVVSSSAQQRALGFGIPLPAATAAGDEVELVNTRGLGFRFDDLHDAINGAIRSLGGDYLEPAATEEDAFAYGTPIAIPAAWARVEGVCRQDPDDADRWRSLPKATRPNGYGWWVDKAARTVVLSGSIGYSLDGATLQLRGLQPPGELNADDDETAIDALWLRAAVLAELALARHMRMPTPETERAVYLMQQDADRHRLRVFTRFSAFSERLP